MGILFWEGGHKRMESPSFYFHLEPDKLMLGGGLYMFPKQMLVPYRDAVVHPTHGKKLASIVSKLAQQPGFYLGGAHYKNVPRGYGADHPNAELLKHNGLYVGLEMPIPAELMSADLVEFCFDHYRRALPLHQWLVDFVKRL
jgi:uncharacterized protein (TIGR02453 family)